MIRLRQQSSTTYPIPLLMLDSSNNPVTGATVSVTLSKNGGSFASASGTVSEVGNGIYSLAGNATDRNTLGPLVIRATATGATTYQVEYGIVAYDPYATGRGLPAIDASGNVKVQPTNANGDALATTKSVHGFATVTPITHDGDNETSGTTLRAAIVAATSGTLILIGPGVFQVDGTLSIPAGVTIRGAGRGITQLSMVGGGGEWMLIPGNRTCVEHLTVSANNPDYLWGVGSSTVVTDGVIRHCDLVLSLGGNPIHITSTGAGRFHIEDVLMAGEQEWGFEVMNAAHIAHFRDCQIFVRQNENTEDFKGFQTGDAAYVTLDNVSLHVNEASATGYTMKVAGTSQVSMARCSFPSMPINLASSTCRVRAMACTFDRSATTGTTSRLIDIPASDLRNLDASISSRSTYAGTDTAGTTTLLGRLTNQRALNLDTIPSIYTVVQLTDASTATLLNRLTALRAGYLDSIPGIESAIGGLPTESGGLTPEQETTLNQIKAIVQAKD